MSTGTVERTAGVRTRHEPPQQQQQQPTGSWFAALGRQGRRAFRAAFAGYMLDAFDLIVLTLWLTRSARPSASAPAPPARCRP